MTTLCADLYDLPTLPYNTAWALQQDLVTQAKADEHLNTLVLLEHEPVLTLGRAAEWAHYGHQLIVLKERGIPIQVVRRGGSVTYHGPGQIVGYPILQLRHFCPGPKAYMRMLEDVIIRVLDDWGIEGKRIENFTGVWVSCPTGVSARHAKVAAMGVRIERGITLHGFALNVTTDLKPFDYIVPCGIEGCRVTSMSERMGESPDLQIIRARLSYHFSEVFGLEWNEVFRELPRMGTNIRLSA